MIRLPTRFHPKHGRLKTLAAAVLAISAICLLTSPLRAQDDTPPGGDPGAAMDESDPHAGHDHGADPHAEHTHDSGGLTAQPRLHSWPAEAIELLRRVPIQDDGRVKPFDTFARYTLLRLNGRQRFTLENPDGSKTDLDPVAWMLDAMLTPEVAIGHRMFVVEDSNVLVADGFVPPAGRSRRDRFSYAELFPVRDRIAKLASQYARVKEQDRTVTQNQLVTLDRNLADFEQLTHFSILKELETDVSGAPRFEEAFDGHATARLSEILARADLVRVAIDETARAHGDGAAPEPGSGRDAEVLSRIARLVQVVDTYGRRLALIPPNGSAADEPEYYTFAALSHAAMEPGARLKPQIELLSEWEELSRSVNDPDAFTAHAKSIYAGSTALAEARAEAGKVGLEVTYHRMDFVYYSLMIFVAAFLLAACTWIWSKNRVLAKLVTFTMAGGVLYLAAGITMRCIIRSRPPVSTLYETILFISAIVVAVSLTAEWLWPKRVVAAVGSLAGAAGMFFAYKFEIEKGVDTMPQLVAVLDTNFWLATHVTTVNIGYAAGLIAGFVGHVYVVGKALGLRRHDDAFYRSIARTTYGILCFGLVFSVVGTVLGGIWANDSWGRFWGWDPKENGALMIVLAELIILHARLGGYIRDWGLAFLSSLLTVIVAFSWWHVNLLGVGLHAYGFTSAIKSVVIGFYAFEGAIALTGLGYLAWTRFGKSSAPGANGTPPAPPALPKA